MLADGLDLDGMGVAPGTDIVSMTRAMARVRDVLGVTQSEARAAVSHKLAGGVLPDVSLAQLEALAAAGKARVCVTIETEDGRTLNLAHLV